jgi:diaminohydroxyphosphoribosylaminopyrimidine deaminase/5-amino-6-(5-phosphoribosylamino)uracil reductase
VREQQLPSLPVDEFSEAFEQAPVRQPMRIVVDSTGQLSGREPFFVEPGRKISANAAQIRTNADDIEHWHLPDGNGRVNLAALLDRLAEQQCNNVLVEAGATLAGAFVQQGLVDEMIAFVAPTLMGSTGRPLLELPIATMAGQLPLRITDVRAVGRDWQITAMLEKQTES